MRPLSECSDPELRRDLIGAVAAMKRAQMRARELARATGTKLAIWVDGQVRELAPDDPYFPEPMPPAPWEKAAK